MPMAHQNWRSVLLENFDYDRYANLLWLPYVIQAQSEKANRVFAHILGANEIWLRRLKGVSLSSAPAIPFSEEEIQRIHSEWVVGINRLEYDEVISYRNLRGEPFELPFGAIARHAANHGTYHRGQLREIFENEGNEFPETDFVGYIFSLREQ
jgi:uncharacterized damage-inducible protein DinB